MADSRNESRREHPLYALMLKLRAQTIGSSLPNAGQQAHAALLDWLRAVDPGLAERLHEPNLDRPFTCSSLWFPNERAVAIAQRENRRLPIIPEQTYWLRLTLLTDELFRTLTKRFLDVRPIATGANNTALELPSLRLGSIHFDVVELVAMPSKGPKGPNVPIDALALSSPLTWAGFSSYEQLVAEAKALRLRDAKTIQLEFHSPTAFSDGQQPWGKRMRLFPDADRVFDRLTRVWNAWAPEALRLDLTLVRAYVAEWVVESGYRLETRSLHFDRHAQVGFVGRCAYTIMERTPQTGEIGAGLASWQALHLLASFAFYAGIGQKTTTGMGQARRVDLAASATETKTAHRSNEAPSPVIPAPNAVHVQRPAHSEREKSHDERS